MNHHSEATLHQQLCDYLRLQYPDVIFRSDVAAGIKLTIGQAARHKKLQSSRAYPDLFIAEPRHNYHGLFIELKAEGAGLYKKDGTLIANAHIQEQHDMLIGLVRRGYRAVFAQGFENAQCVIDEYLGSV